MLQARTELVQLAAGEQDTDDPTLLDLCFLVKAFELF